MIFYIERFQDEIAKKIGNTKEFVYREAIKQAPDGFNSSSNDDIPF